MPETSWDEHELVFKFDTDGPPRFDVYVMDVSYFSGKLECYLRYKRIPHRRIEVTWEQMAKNSKYTGLMQVPVVFDRELNIWLRDTTSIIVLFESAPDLYGIQPNRPIIPSQACDSFLSFLLEEFADEWLWLPALYYRWDFRLDAGNLSRRFMIHDFYRDSTPLNLPEWLAQMVIIDRQHDEYVYQGGVQDEAGRLYVQGIYLSTLMALEAHFTQHPFLLGDHPTLVDFGFAASMFRHFSLDPTPSKIMRLRAPHTYEWVARMWNSGSLKSSIQSGSSPFAEFSSTQALNSFVPYMVSNAKALLGQQESFQVGPLKMKPVAFRAWSASKLGARWLALSTEDQILIDNYLHAQGLSLCHFKNAIPSIMKAGSLWGESTEPPHCSHTGEPSLLTKVLGTPNHAILRKVPHPTSFMLSLVATFVLFSFWSWKNKKQAIKIVAIVYFLTKVRSKYI